MTIHLDIKDINGRDIQLGDTVIGYAKDFEVCGWTPSAAGEHPVAVLDTSRPKPIVDVPLFKGVVVFDQHHLELSIQVTEACAEWMSRPNRICMAAYHYEVVE